jgi:hypothetical protein
MTQTPDRNPEPILTRLEFFADQFERLAKTSRQHALADNFRAFVQDLGGAPLTRTTTLTMLEDYAIGFAQIARKPEQKALVADFQHFVSEINGPRSQEVSPGVPRAPGPDPRFLAYIDPVLTELEAFGDQFERTARTAEQRQLAADFKDWVHHTSRTFFIPAARTLADHLFGEASPRPEPPPEQAQKPRHKL